MESLTPPQETKQAGYLVESIILLESTFKRGISDLKNFDIQGGINIETQHTETSPENKFTVIVSMTYSGMHNETEIISAFIKMSGVYEKYGEPIIPDEKFKAINAPAIIYPFIRELLFNNCLRAGITNVFLPTINFKP